MIDIEKLSEKAMELWLFILGLTLSILTVLGGCIGIVMFIEFLLSLLIP